MKKKALFDRIKPDVLQVVEALRELHDAYHSLPNKTPRMFDAVERAGKILRFFPPMTEVKIK